MRESRLLRKRGLKIAKDKRGGKGGQSGGNGGIIRAERIADAVKNGEISLKLNPEKQNPHILGSKEYNADNNKSYFTIDIDKLQSIINEKYGTGEIKIKPNGQIKETIEVSENIGVCINEHGVIIGLTNRFTIHYSKKRTHIVPSERKTEK